MSNNWKENRLIDREDLKILTGKFIDREKMIELGKYYKRNQYGKYILNVAKKDEK